MLPFAHQLNSLTRGFVLCLTTTVLIACQPAPHSPRSTATGEEATKPRVSGIDYAGMDTSVTPQDDFFGYMNGRWIEETDIPADKSSWGSFSTLRDNSLFQLKSIVDDIAQLPETALTLEQQQIKNLYQSFSDEQQINTNGLTPLIAELQTINTISSYQQLGAYFVKAARLGIKTPLGYWVDQDAKNTHEYTIYFSQSGLGLPDRDYYFDASERGKKLLSDYQDYLEQLLGKAGLESNPSSAAERIIALETRLASSHWTRVQNRNRDKTYNSYTSDELIGLMGDYPIESLLITEKLARQRALIVRQPDYFQALGQVFQETPLEDWKHYLSFHLLNSFAGYLSADFDELHFDFYSRKLRGVEVQEPRWKRAVGFINGSAGELLGQLYVAEHFPDSSKQRMTQLVQHLSNAYEKSINNLDWMTAETKTNALKKLTLFTPKIGYPDKWRDYSKLELSDNNLIGNVKAVRLYNHHYELSKLGQPINRDEWFMPPQIVNAYYNSSMNEIVFPAAILQPPFFNPQADDAVNYGAIGGVIGHEIGHGFDDQGSKSDGHGTLTNWWTDQDKKAFEIKARQLVTQYNHFEPLPGQFVNGELTLGENIGDLGGLSIALKAYQLSLNGKPSPVIDGFNGEQRVFMGWAQVWRIKRREATQLQLLKTDPHSPPQYRVNGVLRNIGAFYEVFNVTEQDALYLPPEQRVTIW